MSGQPRTDIAAEPALAGNRKLYIVDAAEYLGITPATFRRYICATPTRKAYLPAEDSFDIIGGHRRPWWLESTLRPYRDRVKRPGARTDLPAGPAPRSADGRGEDPRSRGEVSHA